MWIKLMAPALTSAIGLGVAAISIPQEPVKVVVTQDDAKDGKRVEVKQVTTTDRTDELADVYDRLVKVRFKRLDDRPKTLADEAAKLYREAVAAAEKGEHDKAMGLTKAASELTRALELSLKNSRVENDPDLPPPPRRSGSKVFLYRTESKVGEMPAELHDKVALPEVRVDGKERAFQEKTVTIVGRDGKPNIEAKGNVHVRLNVQDGGAEKRDVIVERSDEKEQGFTTRSDAKAHGFTLRLNSGDDGPRTKVESGGVAKPHRIEIDRKMETRSDQPAKAADHKELAEILELHIKELNDKKQLLGDKIELKLSDDVLDKLKTAESMGKLHEALARVHQGRDTIQVRVIEKGASDPVDAAGAVDQLKKARVLILKAREAGTGEEKSVHLDAARDLFNSARREAEAGRFDRAAELARAAESLAQAHKTLRETHVGNANPHAAQERKVEVRVLPRDGAKAAEKAPEGLPDETGPVEKVIAGAGVQIAFEDGKAAVQDLIPGGPAARDGRIKPGDAIVGVETDGGAILGFGDKSLAEVTKLLRGPVGSKVKLIVQPKGSSDHKVYQIERQVLATPKAEAPAKPEGGGDGAIPPMID